MVWEMTGEIIKDKYNSSFIEFYDKLEIDYTKRGFSLEEFHRRFFGDELKKGVEPFVKKWWEELTIDEQLSLVEEKWQKLTARKVVIDKNIEALELAKLAITFIKAGEVWENRVELENS